jgi:hypothetical protein
MSPYPARAFWRNWSMMRESMASIGATLGDAVR